jgi:CubicO group peptidase (beta-lactamase class C family)
MHILKLNFAILFALLLLHTTVLHAQLSADDVDALAKECLQRFEVAGIAVGIVKDGKIIHTKGYGVKSVDTKEPVDENTNFGIASNSKAFTTAALSILVDEGKISWQDKVIDHIPEFKMYNAYITENFMIEDLLTHRSGLGLGIGDLMFFPDGADFTIDDVLSSFQHFKPQSAFRTKFDYDNLLYFVAGEVIARVSGMSWEAFVQQRIMEPLNMDHSYTEIADKQNASNLATPHSTGKGAIRTISHLEDMVNGAAGGIFSNVDDICNWMLVHLNHGKYGDSLDQVLFTEERQHEMWSLHTLLDVNRNPRYNSHFAGYGLGWGVSDLLGNLSVSHTGGLPGMLSRTVLIPDLNLGVVVLTNTESGGAAAFGVISRTIVDSYLGLDDYQWSDKFYEYFQNLIATGDEVTTAVWQTVEEVNDDHINPDDFIGIYEDNWFGKVEVFLQNDQLWIRCHRSPKLNGPLAYYNANTFAVKWEYQDMNADAFAMFSLDENGKAQSIKMKGISPNIDFSFDFQDLDLQRVED